MKTVINLSTSNDIVSLTEVTPDKYYGVLVGGSERCFITKTEYENGNFTVRSLDELTKGNSYYSVTSPSLTATIQLSLSSGYAVYEFDTAKELLEWLIDEKSN